MIKRLNRGISLLEMLLLIAVIGTLGLVIANYTVQQANLAKARHTANSMKLLLQAVNQYYRVQAKAPASIDVLRQTGYLGQEQARKNPWDAAYSLQQPAGAKYVLVSTIVPNKMVDLVKAELPIITLQSLGDKQEVAASMGLVKQLHKPNITTAAPIAPAVPIRQATVLDFSHSITQAYPKPQCSAGYVPKIYVLPSVLQGGMPAYPLTSVRAYAQDLGPNAPDYYVVYDVNSLNPLNQTGDKKVLVMTKCESKASEGLVTFD